MILLLLSLLLLFVEYRIPIRIYGISKPSDLTGVVPEKGKYYK